MVVYFPPDKESTLSTVLNKWFDERVKYKDEMKKAFKAGDKEKGAYYHLMPIYNENFT